MFSGLTKLADKAFVLGFFLPALLGALTILGLNTDIMPARIRLSISTDEKTLSNLTVMLLFVWSSAVLLMVGNHWMYRVLEGYTWPLCGKRFRRRELARRAKLVTREREAYACFQAASLTFENASRESLDPSELDALEDDRKAKGYAYFGLKKSVVTDFPQEPSLVLPTRLGNVIRSFELYPAVVYEVESISTWSRLSAVIPKDYQAALNNAKCQVDFFLSLTFVSVGVGLASLVRSLAMFLCDRSDDWLYVLLAGGVALLSVARLCYLASVPSARAWGEVVKSAFDLYLPALAVQLGYALPEDLKKQTIFWQEFTGQFQYATRAEPTEWNEASSAPLHGANDLWSRLRRWFM